MIGHIKLELYSKVLFIICLLYVKDITAGEWKNTYFQLYYNLTSLPNSTSLNGTLVAEESNAPTVMSCSLFCAKNGRHSLYYNMNEMICYCNTGFDTRLTPENPTIDDSSEILYGNMTLSLQVSTNTSTLKYDIQPYKENCLALYQLGYNKNIKYTLQPIEENVQDIYCDMDTFERVNNVGADDCLHWFELGYTEDGVYKIRLSNGTTIRAWCDQIRGGLTVIQRRLNGFLDFYRTWTEYVNGFGDAAGEYWLGLEAIYLLSQRQSSLHIDMETFPEDNLIIPYAFARYDDFSLTSAAAKYMLSIGSFSGNCGDSLVYHNQQPFSTLDNDNSVFPDLDCTGSFQGGWWYWGCAHSNLNGVYRSGFYTSTVWEGVTWTTCWGYHYSIKTCSMGIIRI